MSIDQNAVMEKILIFISNIKYEIIEHQTIILGIVGIFIIGIILFKLFNVIKNNKKEEVNEECVSEVPLPVMESAKITGAKKGKKATLTKHKQIKDEKELNELIHNVANNGKKNILIVDDSKLILKKLGDVLSKNYNVSLANDGFEALEMVSKNIPDLILSDIEMPNNEKGEACSGFDLLSTLQKSVKYSTIPVILMTANIDIAADKGFELGASGFLSKPFENEIMLEQIEYCLNS